MVEAIPERVRELRASEQGEGLVNFDGRGHYHPPQLTWLYTLDLLQSSS